jgi:two-component system chemotaxis sensor kinase CheA
MSQYHELFLTETREHLKKLAALTLALERNHADKAAIDDLFRSVHSVKGMAASMGFDKVAEVAHTLEDLMDRVRKGLPVDSGLFDLLLGGEAALTAMVDDIASGGNGALDTSGLLGRISAYQENPAAAGSVQQQPTAEVVDKSPPAAAGEGRASQQTVTVKTAQLDDFLATTGELITVKHRLTELARSSGNHDVSAALQALDKHLRTLHNQVMAVRLLPLSVITERFPRMVRDLARSCGKEITFSIQGAEIELDRSIIDLIGDPLSHILRNAVDHGIETPPTRAAAGKPPAGRIRIVVSREKDQVGIRIEDDGCGMDPEKIAAAAVAKGFLAREKLAGLSQEEKLLLICQPGFSTAEKVTTVSGRGVGMDVVRDAIQSMGGAFALESEHGAGSSFLLRLPLTLAIINVLLVKVGAFTMAIPLTAVERTMELHSSDIAIGAAERSLTLDEETLPLVPLQRLYNLKSGGGQIGPVQLFITVVKGEKIAVQVDQILGHQEVFVKALPRPLAALKGINGATVLGNGEIVFILDILNKFITI